jgi:hypothetical protein
MQSRGPADVEMQVSEDSMNERTDANDSGKAAGLSRLQLTEHGWPTEGPVCDHGWWRPRWLATGRTDGQLIDQRSDGRMVGRRVAPRSRTATKDLRKATGTTSPMQLDVHGQLLVPVRFRLNRKSGGLTISFDIAQSVGEFFV